MVIVCEGANKKSEAAYLNGFKSTCDINSKKIEIEIIPTRYNTGKELVKFIKDRREFDQDILWVVYDKDGYTKHSEVFDEAKANNINIAFSSICFEYWILLHFGYTSRPFENSDKIKSYIKKNYGYIYEKSNEHMFNDICQKGSLDRAMKGANKIKKLQLDASPGKPIYHLNPYTNMDELIDDIKRLETKS